MLYLGAASGTSVSHVSDIVGPEGAVYAVEFSHRRWGAVREGEREWETDLQSAASAQGAALAAQGSAHL